MLGIWTAITWMPGPLELLTGVVVSGIIALLLGNAFYVGYWVLLSPKRFFYFIVWSVYFILRFIKGSLITTYRIFNPWQKVEAGIVKVRTRLEKESSKVFLMNSITFSEEALAIDEAAGNMFVYCLDLTSHDPKKLSRTMFGRNEDLIERIFKWE